MRRREFMQMAIGSLPAAVWTAGALQAGGEDNGTAAAGPATKALAAKYGRLMQEKGLKRQTGTGLVYPTSYANILYGEELYFDSIALLYYGLHQPAIDGIHMFLRSQREDGFICRRIDPDRRRTQSRWGPLENEEHCKPLLAQIAQIVAGAIGGLSWLLSDDLTRIERYLDYWLTACDIDRNGLSEWSSAPHAGADTQFERVGTWRSRYCEGVDLNCYLYRECLAVSGLARTLGKTTMAAKFTQEAQRKKQRILELWDPTDSFFYDRDRRTGKPIRVRSGAPFLTLWAGVAGKGQAQELVTRHLKNPREFWTPLPVPSYARSEPSYTQRYEPPAGADVIYALPSGHCNWCGGTWPHWNYLIIHGLQQYGFHTEARDIAAKWLAAASNPAGLFEWYNAETGQGEGQNPFWAGSSVLGIFVPTELRHDVDPTAEIPPDRRLDLRKVQDELGLLS